MPRSVILAALLVSTPALAQDHPVPAAPAPKPATAPGSGHTRAFLDPLGKLWEVPGRDGLDVWFAATDTNGDGKIDRTEITAAAEAWFKTLDLNGDGAIDPDEETAYENDRSGGHGQSGDHEAGAALHHEADYADNDSFAGERGRRGGRGRRHGSRGGYGSHPGDPDFGSDRTGALMDVSNPVVSADINLDRGVSEFEAVTAATKRLSRLDMDGDGKLSLAEARTRRDAQQNVQRSRSNPAPAAADQPPAGS